MHANIGNTGNRIADGIKRIETEEHLKNDIRDFLRDTYYRTTNAINTKDKKDLVIYLGKDTNSKAGVIIEAKRPSNKSEMINSSNLNKKAFHELVLYYLRERIVYKNLEVKHLIITNIYEWFIFDATLFDKLFAQNKHLVRQFSDFEGGRLADAKTDFPAYISSATNVIQHDSLNHTTWVVSSSQDQRLLQKVISKGKRLENYLGAMGKYGIKTGITEAFVIDETLKQSLIAKDGKSRELIKPFLLGRDVKPYNGNKVSNWLLLIPKGFTIRRNLPQDSPYYIREPSPRYGNMEFSDAWCWFSGEYPAIAEHLLKFKDRAESRTDKGDFWWELRACDYYDLFEQPKIMYQKFQVKPCFIYDDKGLFCNDSMWIIPYDDKMLLGILNSKMGWWLISKYCTAIQNGYQLIWKYFSQVPIAAGNDPSRESIADLVNEILAVKKQSSTSDTTDLEAQIDRLVYQLYDLTEEEIKIIESMTK